MLKKIQGILYFLCKTFIGVLIIYPLLYGAFASIMKPDELFHYPPYFFPVGFHIANYQEMFATIPIIRLMWNSLLVSLIIVAGQIVIASLAAYAFAFFQFKGRNFLFLVVLATTMIPGEATIVSNFLTIAHWNLLDTYIALVLPNLISAIGIFMLRQYYLTIPRELKEAATMDGCNSWQFLLKVVTPLSRGSLFSLGLYEFLSAWNMYMWPLLVTSTPEHRTVQVGIGMLNFPDAQSFGLNLAGVTMVILPSIVVFMLGKNQLIQGMTAGAIKG